MSLKFLKEVQVELKKVKWPSRQQVIKMTGIVLGVSTAVGIYISGVDFILTKIMAVAVK